MKIALYSRVWTSHGLGGMQVVAREVAHGLVGKGHLIHVFTSALPNFTGLVKEGQIIIHHIPSAAGKYSTEYFDGALELFYELGGFDVVYSHSTAGRRHLGRNVPVVAHWHGIGGMKDVENLAKIGVRVEAKKFDVDVLQYAHHIAGAPHEARYIVENGAIPERVHTIFYGTDSFWPSSIERTAVRRRLGFDDLDFVVGLAGRLVTDKGIGQVASVLPKLDPRVRILLVGDGGIVRSFKERTVHQPSVSPDEMRGYYNAMDLLIDPTTRNQGFDITPIEAACCGTPLLLSNVGSFEEVFDSIASFFELGNLEELAANINALARLPSIPSRRDSIRQFALSKFTAKMMTDRVESLLHDVVEYDNR